MQRFIRRGGLLPNPEIGRSALAPGRRDGVAGAMLPQPLVAKGAKGRRSTTGSASAAGARSGGRRSRRKHGRPRPRVLRALTPISSGSIRRAWATLLGCASTTATSSIGRVGNGSRLLVRPDRFIAERIGTGDRCKASPLWASATGAADAPAPNPYRQAEERLHERKRLVSSQKSSSTTSSTSTISTNRGAFYKNLFNLQFSARNHPDSSAAMRLANMEMRFFSFGRYHHDICLVKHGQLKMDNGSMMHFLDGRANEREGSTPSVLARARWTSSFRDGRLLASAKSRTVREPSGSKTPTNIGSKCSRRSRPERVALCSPECSAGAAPKVRAHTKRKWFRELILLVPTITRRRFSNKTEDYGVFQPSRGTPRTSRDLRAGHRTQPPLVREARGAAAQPYLRA